jgi:hypothetical protein
VTPERLAEIKKWRTRVRAADMEDAPSDTLRYILDSWLVVIDELIEAVETSA